MTSVDEAYVLLSVFRPVRDHALVTLKLNKNYRRVTATDLVAVSNPC